MASLRSLLGIGADDGELRARLLADAPAGDVTAAILAHAKEQTTLLEEIRDLLFATMFFSGNSAPTGVAATAVGSTISNHGTYELLWTNKDPRKVMSVRAIYILNPGYTVGGSIIVSRSTSEERVIAQIGETAGLSRATTWFPVMPNDSIYYRNGGAPQSDGTALPALGAGDFILVQAADPAYLLGQQFRR